MTDHTEHYGRAFDDADGDFPQIDMIERRRADPASPKRESAMPASKKRDARLSALTGLASVDIETTLVTDLSGTLHNLFDPICDKTLPIYFGPLLGRLYLEGL